MSMQSLLDKLREDVSSRPLDPRAHFELGCAAEALHDFELARECFSEVTRLAASVAVGHFNLGNACFALRKFDEAVAAFTQAARLSSDRGTLNNLGNALAASEQYDRAVTQYQRALELPDDGTDVALIQKNLGIALESIGDLRGAELAYRDAAKHSLEPLSALVALGRLLLKSNPQAAAELLREQADAVRQSPELLVISAELMVLEHEYAGALSCLLEANRLAPEHPAVLKGLGGLYQLQGKHFEALACFHRALTLDPSDASIHSGWLRSQWLQATVDLSRLRKEAEAWGAAYLERTTRQNLVDPPADEFKSELSVSEANTWDGRPLRIGILLGSGDPLSIFLTPWFANGKLLNYELFCYSDRPRVEEVCNDLLAEFPEVQWRSTRHLRDDLLRQAIANDMIDGLIDWSGHGLTTRLGVLVVRSAPVQIAWGESGATTGVSNVDGILVHSVGWTTQDAESFEEYFAEYFSEAPLLHPQSLFAVVPAASRDPRPMDLATADSGELVAFGACCAPAQLLDSTVGLWAKLLRSAPGAVLRLGDRAYADPQMQQIAIERFELHGIQREQIIFAEAGCTREFFRNVQVTLDPSPSNSAANACESLLSGVPVVAMFGDSLQSRMTASVLHAAELDAWCAHDAEAYCQIARQLCQNAPSREELVTRVHRSPLCDHTQWSRTALELIKSKVNRD